MYLCLIFMYYMYVCVCKIMYVNNNIEYYSDFDSYNVLSTLFQANLVISWLSDEIRGIS